MYWGIKTDLKFLLEPKQSEKKYKNAFGVCTEVTFSIPYNNGKMTDSDWTTDDIKFNYSIFDCNISYEDFSDLFKNFQGKLDFYYENTILEIFTLKPSIGFRYSSLYFNGEDGYGCYGSSGWTSDGNTHEWNSPYSHYFPDGKYHLAVIDYQSQTFAVFTGFSASVKIFNRFNFLLGFNISPYSFVLAKDRHLPNDYITADYFKITTPLCVFEMQNGDCCF